MSRHVSDQGIYRDAFRKADEFSAIIEVSPHGRLVDASDRLLSTCHLERDSAVGRPLDRLFRPDIADRLIRLGRAAIATHDDSASATVQHQPPSARLLDHRFCAHALSSRLAFLRASSTPRALSSPRDALLKVGVLSDAFIYIYDVARRRTCFMNASLSRFLDTAPGTSLRWSSIMPLVHPDDLEHVVRQTTLLPTIGAQVLKDTVRMLRGADCTWRRLEHRYAALARNADGTVRSIIGCALDITDKHSKLDHATDLDILFKSEEIARRQIARDLHDSTAQHLVAADLMVGAHLIETGENPDRALVSARENLSRALREIRTLSFLLHPPGMKPAGLVKFLEGFARGFAKRSNLQLTIDIDAAAENLPPQIELIFFRVCQEAFMNVRKHANACGVALRLYLRESTAFLEVEDDGDGIDRDDETSFGVGIASMRERLQEAGGTLIIENTGGGTIVRALAPLKIVN